MDWLRRAWRPPSSDRFETGGPTSGAAVQASPGIAALFDKVDEDQSHAILDLGSATDSSLQVYGRYGRWIRFGDLLPAASSHRGWNQALRELPSQPERPYDLIFGWDVLDRLFPEERPGLIRRLAEVSSSGSRLHVVVDAAQSSTMQPRRFGLLDVERLTYEADGPARPARRRLLPAEIESLLVPFEVNRAFTLKGGFREYVAIRP